MTCDCGHEPTYPMGHAYDPIPGTVRIEDQSTWLCRCGVIYTAHGIGTGYARTTDGRTLCYACADAAQRADIETADAMTVYHTGDTVTTWTGGVLGRVVGSSRWRNALTGSRMMSLRIRTPGGRIMAGRYGCDWSQAVTLRPVHA